jgi:transcriptional regulator with XRE-family HTH domain
MSELGNELRKIRDRLNLGQEDFAKEAGVSWRTICNIEDGESVRKSSLDEIVKNLQRSRMLQKLGNPVTDSDADRLYIAWIKLKLEKDADRFWIDPKSKHERIQESNDLAPTVVAAINQLPKRYQEQILKACDRPEILKSIAHLNDLHDRLTQ